MTRGFILTLLNNFVFIPLILTVIISVVLAFFAIMLKIKNGKSTMNVLIALVLLIVGSLYAIIHNAENAYFFFACAVTVSLIPLIFFVKYNIKADSTPTVEEPVFVEEPEAIIPELEEDTDLSLIDVSRDFMIQAAEALTEDDGMNKLLEFINTRLIENTAADGGAILLVDDFDDVITVKAFSGDFPPPYKLPQDLPHKIIRVETSFRFASFPLTENIFGEVARSGHAELITDPKTNALMFENEPEDFLKLGSYIFIPLKVKDTVIGITALARKATSKPFGETEFKAAEVLTGFASTAIKNIYSFQEFVEHSELTRESDIACKLQEKMHPKLLPAIPTLSLGHYFKTADGVCGDYYDVIPSRKDRISFVVADIAGKGMNSLIIMVMIRAILRLIVNTTQSAATILSWANRGVCADNTLDHFASLSLINYDSTEKKIQFSTAGTTPILLYEAESKSMRKISSSSEPIGVEKTTTYADNEMVLKPGDIVVTYTDGLVETVDSAGNQYTAQRLIDVVCQNSSLPGKEIANLVKADINKFSNSKHQHDDQTLLVIKIQ